jgi:alpha-tubulin suppressor-like RCC1 family protein
LQWYTHYYIGNKGIYICPLSVSLSRPQPLYTRTPGVVLTFGQGDVGQLGLGTEILERMRPALVPGVDHVIDLCAGGMHTVCLTESGEVRAMLVT